MERIPTKREYEEALDPDLVVYEGRPWLEAWRHIRIRVARASDPFYRIANWVESIPSRVSKIVQNIREAIADLFDAI